MKKRILATIGLITAIFGFSQMSHADDESAVTKFTPSEKLDPEFRQQVNAKAYEITKDMDVDWDHVVVGVNENNEVCFAIRTEAGLTTVSSFSCYGTGAAKLQEK